MTRRRTALLALPALLAACAVTPLPPADPNVGLPPDAVVGAGDPTRAAIIRTAFGFSQGAPFAGQPTEAARAIAELEFLSNTLITDPRYQRDPLVAVRFADARPEWRGAVGIAEGAPAQLVIDNLFAFARNPAATPLSPSIFAADAPLRLANLPRMPRTNAATAAAQQLLTRLDSDRGGRGFIRR